MTRPRFLNLRTGGNLPATDLTLPLVGAIAAVLAVVVMIWSVM